MRDGIRWKIDALGFGRGARRLKAPWWRKREVGLRSEVAEFASGNDQIWAPSTSGPPQSKQHSNQMLRPEYNISPNTIEHINSRSSANGYPVRHRFIFLHVAPANVKSCPRRRFSIPQSHCHHIFMPLARERNNHDVVSFDLCEDLSRLAENVAQLYHAHTP